MLAAAMMQDTVDHPLPGFGGYMMFAGPTVQQPSYAGQPLRLPRFEDRHRPLLGAPIHMQRNLDSASPRKVDAVGLWTNHQFRRPGQWRSQQQRNPGAPYLGGVQHANAPHAMVPGTQPTMGIRPVQSMRPGNSVLGVKRKNKRRSNRFTKKNRVEGGGLDGHMRQEVEDGEFRPPRLKDLRKQNRKNARKFFPRPPLSKPSPNQNSMPDAPRNTTSYIMETSKLGLNAPRASPALFQTPTLSPSPWASGTAGEQLVEEAKELQVDPYGSMNGCIRLRTPDFEESGDNDNGADNHESSAESEATTSSDSVDQGHQPLVPPVDNVQQLDERMDHGLRRFEMLYSADRTDHAGSKNGDRFLQTRIEEQENQIAHLEEENLTLREKLYLAEQELKEIKRRSGSMSDEEVDGAWSAGEEASCAAASRAGSVDAC